VLGDGYCESGASAMAKSNKRPEEVQATSPTLAELTEQSQLDFEITFFSKVLESLPTYVDVLRAHGNNLTVKGRVEEGMAVDKRLIQLRPEDCLAHYNLACSYALMKQCDQAIKTLRKAIELGYRDFRYMKQDRDLESVRRDPRFRQLIREYESR
jgi:tetratricopeptide (TPR) repeat protein